MFLAPCSHAADTPRSDPHPSHVAGCQFSLSFLCTSHRRRLLRAFGLVDPVLVVVVGSNGWADFVRRNRNGQNALTLTHSWSASVQFRFPFFSLPLLSSLLVSSQGPCGH